MFLVTLRGLQALNAIVESSSERLCDGADESVAAVGVTVTILVEMSWKDGESTVDVRVKMRTSGVANKSVEAVEVMLVVESRLINKAKASVAAKTTAKTRVKTAERSILLALREDQWRVQWSREAKENVEKDLNWGWWRWCNLRVVWNSTSTFCTDACEEISANRSTPPFL